MTKDEDIKLLGSASMPIVIDDSETEVDSGDELNGDKQLSHEGLIVKIPLNALKRTVIIKKEDPRIDRPSLIVSPSAIDSPPSTIVSNGSPASINSLLLPPSSYSNNSPTPRPTAEPSHSGPTSATDLDFIRKNVKKRKKKHSGFRIKCPIEGCGWSIKKAEYQNHVDNHDKIMPFICPYPGCGRRFHQNPALKKHIEVHIDKSEICPFCGKVYKIFTCYFKHLETHPEF